MMRHLLNVSPPCGAEPISSGIPAVTAGLSLFSARQSSPPTVCLTVNLPIGRWSWVPTFHIIDPMDDLGTPSTPVVQQFRADSYETCNLTTCHSHWGVASVLLTLLGLPSFTTLKGIHIYLPYHPFLALNRRGFPEGFACRHLNPVRYIVRGALYQPHSAWQAHPRRNRQEHAGYSR